MKNLKCVILIVAISFLSQLTYSQSLNVLVIGSTESIESSYAAFDPTDVTSQLDMILSGDPDYIGTTINVEFHDIYREDSVWVNIGGNGSLHENWIHKRFSLFTYCNYPADTATNRSNLQGGLTHDWDYVIIMGDPYMISLLPGYYALGVNEVLDYIEEGGAEAFLFMQWPDDTNSSTIDHFEDVTYRIGDGAVSNLPVIPAGLAWDTLNPTLNDASGTTDHPSPNGTYLAAASIYSTVFLKNATYSTYIYNNQIADQAYQTSQYAQNQQHYNGTFDFVSPFSSCNIITNSIDYLQTGSSTENGFQVGFIDVWQEEQLYSTTSPYNFNYGRANYYFEPWKRYKNDPVLYPYALGFPMQDHSISGDSTTFYGIDYREDDIENGTDLGVARYMLNVDQASQLRAVPVRSITAELLKVDPTETIYSDSWHISHGVNRAVGSYMFTLLTGKCGLQDSTETGPNAETFHTGMRVGYNTAWTVMHLKGKSPGFRVLRTNISDTIIEPTTPTTLEVFFLYQPTDTVRVTISSDNDPAVDYGASELIFTPSNYDVPQTVSVVSLPGPIQNDQATLYFTAESNDIFFNDFYDAWAYSVQRELQGQDVVSACDSLVWIDGNTYYTDNSTATYTYINGAASGSDSTVALELTINNTIHEIDVIAACDSLVWVNGNTYYANNNTATYTFVGGASSGCDSVVTLDLTIGQVSDITTSVNNNIIEANNTGASYVWLDCDNNFSIVPGETNQTFSPAANGNYAVQLMEGSCVDTSTCIAITTIGILENDFGEELLVYPNPTDGEFSLDLGASYPAIEISISDINGKLILSEQFNQTQVIDLSIQESKGVYIISVNAEGNTAIIRLVKN